MIIITITIIITYLYYHMNSFNKYLKWASDSLDVYYNNSIDIRDYDVNNNIERGIVNYQDVISKDTILFSIPFSKLLTIESIIQDVAKALFQKWANALPEDQRSEETIASLNKNATESTYFVVKMFMDRFNEAAEQLKSQPDEQ